MDAQTFLNNFGSIAEAPGGVGKLRRFILDLAVHGKLVPQNAADEPAARFLDRVEQERLRRFETGELRGGLDVTNQRVNDVPYDLPEGWQWTTFGAASINRDSERIPLKSSDRALRQGEYDYYGASGVIDKIDDYLFDGDLLLISEDGANLTLRSTPIAFMASGRFWVNNHAHVIDSLSSGALRYLAVYANAIDLKPYLTGIAQPKLNQRRMNSIPVPFPPETEQERIVTEVDELMQLCDDLEARQQARGHVTTRLRVSSFNALTNAETDGDLHIAWSRIHTNWGALTDHADSVDSLRQTIRHLAVGGKLTPQDSTEESASILIDKINELRREAWRESGGPRSYQAPLPAADWQQIALPSTWQMTCLEALTHPVRTISYGILKPGPEVPGGIPVVKVKDIQAGSILVEHLRRTSPEINEKYRRSSLLPGDALVSIRGTVGKVAIVPAELEGANITQDSARLAFLDGVDVGYMVLFLRSPLAQRYFRSRVKGAAVQGLNIGDLRPTPVPLPPVAEQRRITSVAARLLEMCDMLEAALRQERESAEVAAASACRSSLDARPAR